MFGSLLLSKNSDLSTFKDRLIENFSKILIPELDSNVVTLDCVRNIAFETKKVAIDLVLPTFALRSEKEVAFKVKSAAVDLLPAGTVVDLNVYADVRPAAPQSLLKPGICDVKNVILVASGKGGVGKSTVAANLALALKSLGCRVGVLDADVYGPSLPTMFGIAKDQEIQGIKFDDSKETYMLPLESQGIKLMSMGFLVDQDSAMVWRGPMIASASMQMFFNVVWGDLDYLIVDMPPGTGDVQLTISQRVSVAGALIVSTPQDVALADVVRAKAMFEKVNIPLLGLVENMSYFVCDGCTKRHEIFSHGGARAVAEKMGLLVLGEVPIRQNLRAACDIGIADAFTNLESSNEFKDIAFSLAGIVAKKAFINKDAVKNAKTASVSNSTTEKKKGLPVIN